MPPHQFPIDIDRRIVVNGAKVQHHLPTCPVCGHLDRALIPYIVDEIGVFHARQLALGAERNDNLVFEALALEQLLFHT